MDSIKETIGILSAAIIGSFIGTASKRNDSPLTMIVSVVAGISSAYIFTPIISHYLMNESVGNISLQINYAIAFLLGLLGMTLISILLAITDTLRENPKDIITFVKELFVKNKTTIINNYKPKDEE
jgi:hypothetical protein